MKPESEIKITKELKPDENRHEHSRLIRSAGVMGFWTAISRITGLVRDQIQAYFLGTSHSADAFRAAFALPNMLRRLFGEGAMTASFVPVFTDFLKKKSKKETWDFANNCLFTLGILLIAVTVLGILFSGTLIDLLVRGFEEEPGKLELATDLARMMFVYTLFIGIAALLAAILNSTGIFGAPSFTPILLNLSIIGAATFFARRFDEPAFAFAVGVIIGGALQFIFLIPFARKKGMTFKPVLSPRQKELIVVGRRMLPGILAVGVAQVNALVSMRIASTLEEGAIASLYHANRLEEFTLGIFVISIATVILPLLSRHAAENNIEKLKDSLTFSLRITLLITIPATFGLMILREPIVRILFMHGSFDERSLALTTHALLYYAIGLTMVAGTKIIQPAFFSMKDVKTPVLVMAFAVIVNLVGCLVLKGPLRNGGIALAASISALSNVALLILIFHRRYEGLNYKGILQTIIRITAATAAMCIPVYIITSYLNYFRAYSLIVQIGLLLLCIGLAIIFYTATLKLLRAREIKELAELLKIRSGKK